MFISNKITGRKFVTTFHGTYNFIGSIKKFITLLCASDLIIAGFTLYFHILKTTIKIFRSKEKILVIFRGINVDYFDPTTKLESEEKTFKNGKLIKKKIICACRLTSWKGHELLIEAINLVNVELGYEAFHVIILGSDQVEIYIKKPIRLTEQYRLTNQIKFIDHCKDMALAYKVSDIVISPSIEPEAFGRVAVEAQSMEKLIIASNIGGSNETIIDEKSGFLFESGSPNSLSKKILKVITMDETSLKLLGQQGRKNVIKKFNVENVFFYLFRV